MTGASAVTDIIIELLAFACVGSGVIALTAVAIYFVSAGDADELPLE